MTSYTEERNHIIKAIENPSLYFNDIELKGGSAAHDDGKQNLTIGYGVNLRLSGQISQSRIDLVNSYITDPSRKITAREIALYKAYPNGVVNYPADPAIHGKRINISDDAQTTSIQINRPDFFSAVSNASLTEEEASQMLGDMIQKYEDAFDLIIAEKGWGQPYGKERAALISMFYNLPSGDSVAQIASKMKEECPATFKQLEIYLGANYTLEQRAIARAEIWYEIRYKTNANQMPGLAKRRYAESELLGLYGDEESVTELDSRAAYIVYRKNESTIASYEQKYSSEIRNANIDLRLSGVNQVQTIAGTMQIAADFLNEQYAGDQWFLWDRIWVAAEGGSKIRATNGTSGALLIGGKGNDTLTGSNRDDILIGGEGSDRYELSDGYDRIVDEGPGSDVDVLHLGYHYDMKVFDDGTDLVIVKTGDGGGITRVAKGMIERLEAYDPYRDMTIRAGTDAAGLKTINGGYNAVTAESIEHVLYN